MARPRARYNDVLMRGDESFEGVRLGPVRARTVSLPPSKSAALRAIMISASARLPVSLSFPSGEGWSAAGDDITHGLLCAEALGARVEKSAHLLRLTPSGQEALGGALPVGEAGFLGRVAPTCAAICREGLWEIQAAGTLQERSSPALWSSLTHAGVDVRVGAGWARSVERAGALGPPHLRDARSSQELTALWIATACSGGGDVLVTGDVPSAPYLSLSEEALGFFGAKVEATAGGFHVTAASRSPEAPLVVEADASAAAVALAAGCISGVELRVPAPVAGSAQGDWRIIEHLRAFGCQIEVEQGELITKGGPQSGAELDLSGEPDLAPPIAAVAAHAALTLREPTVLSGLHTLDGKESPRGAVLCDGLQRAGFQCDWNDPIMRIGPGAGGPDALCLDSRGDHRMAFAFALLGVSLPGVSVGGAGSIAKSWPNFWSSMS